jgi:hypothetical protein
MINDVRAALNAILGNVATLRKAKGAGRIFELFIMTGIATRLQAQGFDVWLQRSDGSRIAPNDPDRRFIQRGGAPTGIQPATAGRGNASAIGLRRIGSGSELELWNGIQFEGRSGATHEIDIALVPGDVGAQLRLTGGLPFGRPRVSIECKDVGQPGSVDEMRAFVARMYDLTVLQGHQPYYPFVPPNRGIYPGTNFTNTFCAARTTYRDENLATLNVIARRTGFASGAAAMTSYYAVQPRDSITRGSVQAAALMDAVSQWIATRCP